MGKGLIKEAEYSGTGIKKAVVSGTWMLQLLNFMPRLAPERIESMQKHNETDECFVLLKGNAVLFAADGEERPGEPEAVPLQPRKIYTVPKGVWHALVLSEDAELLIIENSGTVPENSPRCPVTEEQKMFITTASRYIL